MTLGAGTLSLGNPGWIGPVLLALIAIATAVLWGQRADGGRWSERLAGAGFKLAGAALVALLLLDPLWTVSHARPGANQIVVLIDGSRSMAVRDRGETVARGERARAALGPSGTRPAWRARLEKTFALRHRVFDRRVRAVDDPGAVRFEGEGSALGEALGSLAASPGEPIAGAILFSDGIATDDVEALLSGAALPPVYPVRIAGDPAPDLAVVAAEAARTAFEQAPVRVVASLEATGYRGRAFVVELLDSGGAVLASRRLTAGRDDETFPVELRYRPERPGVAFLRIRARPESGPPDAIGANDVRWVAVERAPGPHRLLYLGGRPNWEFKFLRRATEKEPDLQLVAMLRVAPREPRYSWGHLWETGSQGNPFFSGFGADENAIARYDEPVLVRYGTRDATELASGFPKSAEDLFEYHAVLLDDLEAGFLTAEQHALVERFVTERGGGLLVLGGQGGLHQGSYRHTPIERLLPVYLERPSDLEAPGPFSLALSREGWLEPWTRLYEGEESERTRLDRMPPFRVLHRLPSLKPAAVTLMTATARNGTSLPALIAHRAGEGQVVALLLGDLWRWRLRGREAGADFDRFWRQTLRFLVSGALEPLAVREGKKLDGQGHAATAEILVRDRSFAPASDATLTVSVVSPAGETSAVPAEPTAEPGLFEVRLPRAGDGGYRLQARAAASDGRLLAEAEGGVALNDATDELRSLRPRPDLLNAIAAKTGGKVLSVADLDVLARELPGKPVPVTETRTRPLWHSGFTFLGVLACLAGEWILRRRRGAA